MSLERILRIGVCLAAVVGAGLWGQAAGAAEALQSGATILRAISAPGEADEYSFSGQAGDRIWVAMSWQSGEDFACMYWLDGPSGGLHNEADTPGDRRTGVGCLNYVLPATGTYVIHCADRGQPLYVDPQATGGYWLSFVKRPGSILGGVADPDGGPLSPANSGTDYTIEGTLQAPSDFDIWTWQPRLVGDALAFAFATGPGSDVIPCVTAYGPDGGQLKADTCWETGTAELTVVATSLGTHWFLCRGTYRDTAGTYRVTYREARTAPQVTDTYPRDDSPEVSPLVRPTVTFSEPMHKGSVAANLTLVRKDNGAVVPCTLSWQGGNQAQLRPQESLARQQWYWLRVGRQARTPDGRKLGTDYEVLFRAWRLVTQASPGSWMTTIGRYSKVRMELTWPVSEGSLQDRFSLRKVGGAVVPGTFWWLEPKRWVEFTPATYLEANTQYRITVDSGVRFEDPQLGVRRTDWNETFLFTTSDTPVVENWWPRGEGVGTGAAICLRFDRPMLCGTVAAALDISPAVAGWAEWSQGRRLLTYTPNEPLAEDRTYTVTVGAGACAADGQRLRDDFAWSFHTAVSPVPVAPPVLRASARSLAAGTAQVTVYLASTAEVQGVICNLAGRTVALLPAQTLPAGTSTLLWNGRSHSGVAVPAGRYLVRLSACTPEGARAEALVPLVR